MLGTTLIRPKLLILLENRANYDLLVREFSADFEILDTVDSIRENISFDLCILDGVHFYQCRSDLIHRKLTELPRVLPICLVTLNREANKSDPSLWEVIDELIILPVDSRELKVRINSLLKARRLSVENQRLYEISLADAEELRAERRIRDLFISALGHDLRNPLAAAKMSAQLVLRLLNDPEKVKTNISRILSNIERVDHMIEDLLNANRLRAKEKLKFELEELELNSLTKEVLEELTVIHGDRFLLKSTTPEIQGRWNGERLKRVIENLATNAIKYGDSKSPVTVDLKMSQEYVRISVHNEGPAISIKDQTTLFAHFKRTETARAGKQQGWGIGLSFVRLAVESHGGKVWVESMPNHGTTFVCELPRAVLPEKLWQESPQL